MTGTPDALPPGADVHVPDGAPVDDALSRTTDLGVVAHADDLELLALPGIGACRGRDDRWFSGVVCTDGAASVRAGRFAALTSQELAEIRAREQRRAAEVGGYSVVIQLGRPSGVVRHPGGHEQLTADLAHLLEVMRPVNVYTHDLADRHSTHVAVAAALIMACRRLPVDQRPTRVVGCEGWRNLDWLPEDQKVLLDATPHAELGRRLVAVFESQLAGGKRYDLAAEGRRRSNATFRDPRRPDRAGQLTVAMDLTPLVRNDDIDPVRYVTAPIDRMRSDVWTQLCQWFGEAEG